MATGCPIAPTFAAVEVGNTQRPANTCSDIPLLMLTIGYLVKQELGAAGRDLNFNTYSDRRSLFRYDMHTLPSEISSSIGTSTLLAAWNAAIYLAQIEDDRLSDVNGDRRYIDATREVLQQHGGLWFHDESFVISHRRE